MKKIFALALALTLTLTLTGCGNKEQAPNINTTESEKQPMPSTELHRNSSADYETAVSWVNYSDDASELYDSALNSDKMTISSVRHLPIFKCSSADDLAQFKSDFSEVLDFSAQYDEVEPFDETEKRYNAAFFEENALLLVYLTAGSGSYRYGVDSLYTDSDNVVVHIKQVNEVEAGTCDMAGWLICISIPKDIIKTCTTFDADLV